MYRVDDAFFHRKDGDTVEVLVKKEDRVFFDKEFGSGGKLIDPEGIKKKYIEGFVDWYNKANDREYRIVPEDINDYLSEGGHHETK
jgi:hypothetical protein